jgi:hypothetical protein
MQLQLRVRLPAAESAKGVWNYPMPGNRRRMSGHCSAGAVHSREDEFIHVLSADMTVYVDDEVFRVAAGECVFLPRRRAHAWLITSEKAHVSLLIVPGGYNEAFSKMSAPAQRMEVPTDVDTVTYATADLTETIKVFEQYGARCLTADKIRTEMPQYLLQAGG